MKLFLSLLFVFIIQVGFASFLPGDSVVYSCPKAITINKNLKAALDKLYAIKNNKAEINKTFTILHIGDSHVQGDFFSGEIRRQLQSYFGFVGIGAIFPYSLAKSYGPRGSISKTDGKWESYKILSPRADLKLGILGYGLTTSKEKSAIQFSIQEKFPITEFTDFQIWHTSDSTTFEFEMNKEFQLTNQQKFESGWAVSTFKSTIPQTQFKLETKSTQQVQNHFEFLGCELFPATKVGINYHHLGVVGAQFTHFIKSANFNLEQMAFLKPDLIIFSFGTNEAYDSGFDSLSYFNTVSDFIKTIKDQMPETAIVFTTAPDTRSVGRTPPHQTTVNNQLKKIAAQFELSVFDLNTEMGGWGSLYKWHKNDLTLKDKLHFKQPGYALQGRLFTYAFLSSYNQIFKNDQLDVTSLKDTITSYMQKILIEKIVQDTLIVVPANSDSTTIKNNIIVPEIKTKETVETTSESTKTHSVKKGESIYIVGKKYKINYKSILKANNLTEKSVIRPGMKLIIPKNK